MAWYTMQKMTQTSNSQNNKTHDTPSQHILLVEDDPAIATSLKVTFKREGWQLTWLDNVTAVLPKLIDIHKKSLVENISKNLVENTTSPAPANFSVSSPITTALTAIILDVGLPDGDGLSLCKDIRSSDKIGSIKDLPIIFLTARSDEVDRILGLEMGGDDYCPKPFSPRELVARLKAIWRRQAVFNPSLSEKLLEDNDLTSENSAMTPSATNNTPQTFELESGKWEYLPQVYKLYWQGNKLDLSNTERNLLLYMLQHPTQVFSREQLLTAISEYPDHRLARTIDSHIKSIRKQLATIAPAIEVVHTHRGIGYGLCKA